MMLTDCFLFFIDCRPLSLSLSLSLPPFPSAPLLQDAGRRVLIVATTSIPERLERLGLTQRFNIAIDIPSIAEPLEFQTVMQEWADMDPAVAAEISKGMPESIPIKRLLMVLEMARQNSESGEVTSEVFHKCLYDCGYSSSLAKSLE